MIPTTSHDHVPASTRPTWAEARRLSALAWPIVVAQLGFFVMGMVDTIMVGRLGGDALAAVSLGTTWTFAFVIVGRGVAFGLDPLVTQAWGARDEGAFARAMAHGMLLLTLLSIPMIALHFVADVGLRALGQAESSLPLASAYSVSVAASVWPALASAVLRQGLQARGLTRPGMWVAVLGNLVNVPANLVFMYGIGDWEGMGAVGVGWSTSLVRWAMFFAMAGFAHREVRALLRGLGQVSLSRLGFVASLALPVGVQTALEVWGFSFATLISGWFGPTAVAAHTVTLNLAALAFMVPLGLSAAAATRVGNLLGAQRPWIGAGWTAIALGAGVMTLSASLYLAVPGWLVAIYVPNEPEVMALAVTMLPIAAGFQVFDGVQVVSFGVLRGAGDTRVPSLANIVGYYVLGLPLGAALATWGGMGPRGVWVGLTVALGTVAALLVVRLRAVAARGGIRQGV